MKFLEKLGFKDKAKKNLDKKKTDLSNEDYLLVYPKTVKGEVNRTISSLGFIDKDIGYDTDLESLKKEYEENQKKLDEIDENLQKIQEENKEDLENIPKTLDYYKKSSKLKEKMLKGRKYLYLSGWIQESKLKDVEDTVGKYEDSLVDKRKNEETIKSPPTKLKNNKFFRPFEFLVNM